MESLLNLFPLKCYFYFMLSLPVPWQTSDYVGRVIPRSGVVENVRLSVEISFVAATHCVVHKLIYLVIG